MTSKWLCVPIATAMAVALLLTGQARAAERMNDKAIEQHGKQVKEGFDIWKHALERRNLDDAVIRSAAGTIDVKEFLKAFEKDIETFNDRFRKSKSAGSEATALLRRASDVERRVREQGGISTPAEWAALASQCKSLAAAYGVAFPIESMEVSANRLSDEDMAAQLELMRDRAKRVRGPADDAAKKAAGMDKAARETIKLELDSVARLAGGVAAKIKSGEAASVQVSQLLAVAHSVRGKLEALNLPQAARNDWSTVDRAAMFVARAFGEQWTPSQ